MFAVLGVILLSVLSFYSLLAVVELTGWLCRLCVGRSNRQSLDSSLLKN